MMTAWAELGECKDPADSWEFQTIDPTRLPRYMRYKRFVDYVLAVPIAILAAPVILLTMVVVKLTSRGPVIYRQTRLGENGQPYTIYKIRTMTVDCERKSGPKWSTPDDPRVTRVGRFLRKSHLDELPQIWNILRGEMSLVGPRPERPEFVTQLERALPQYRERMLVRPGVTGLAQVQLPPDQDLAGVQKKLMFDLYYVHKASFWLDIRIMIGTGIGIFGIPFAVSRTLLRIPCGRVVEAARRTPVEAATPQVQPA